MRWAARRETPSKSCSNSDAPMPNRLLAHGLGWGLLTLAASTPASTIESAEISFIGSRYHYRFSAHLQAPPAAVRAVVTDYDRLARINDDILVSRVIVRYDDTSLKRQLLMKHCVLLFCFDINFIERVDFRSNGDIATTTIEGEGNFLSGQTVWRIEAQPDGTTRVTMEANQEPDFFIPPVLGPLVMKRSFIKEITETTQRIEELARDEPLR